MGKLVIGMEKSHARGPPDTKLVSHAYDDFPSSSVTLSTNDHHAQRL
jgi:hypothetical protein